MPSCVHGGSTPDDDEPDSESPLTTDTAMLDLSSPSIEARLTKSVPSALQVAISRICEETPEILACILLDLRDRDRPDLSTGVLIELTLTDREKLSATAARFSELIASTPSLAGRVYFASTGRFDALLRQALYRRDPSLPRS